MTDSYFAIIVLYLTNFQPDSEFLQIYLNFLCLSLNISSVKFQNQNSKEIVDITNSIIYEYYLI